MTTMNSASERGGVLRGGESGNVLFLILIAVALFAALSYAVTQSSRSGSGDASSEQNLVNGAEITQYPAGVRTAIVRMIISNNITVDQLYFDPPSDFAILTTTADQQQAVFHPAGGGATYQLAPSNVMASGTDGPWYFNALFQVPNIGTTVASGGDASGNDLIAFLPGLKQTVCLKIDESLGIPAIPTVTAGVTSAADVEKTHTLDTGNPNYIAFPTTAGAEIGTATGEVSGQPFACFLAGSDYIYYHVLIER